MERMGQPIAFLNGRFVPASKAVIPVTDAGFVLGATVSEQLRTFGGRLFRLEEHLARLKRSLEIVGVELPLTWGELAQAAEKLTSTNHALLAPGDDLGLAILVTPGEYAGFGGDPDARPTVCLHTYPLRFEAWAYTYIRGQALVTTDIQQVPASCWPSELKVRSRMHYYLADRQARAVDPSARALLLDRQGKVTETATANLLIYRRDEGLISPPKSTILRGISLAVVRELALALDIGFSQSVLSLADVASADEVLLTTTPAALLPVVSLNGAPIADGSPGEVFMCLLTAWSRLVGINIAQQAVAFAKR